MVGTSAKVGVGLTTPAYIGCCERGALKSQLHFSTDGSDVGGWMSATGPNSFFMSSGTMFDMTAGGWIQKSADGKSSIIATGSAPGLRFFMQTGNTAGSVITPNERLREIITVMLALAPKPDPKARSQWRRKNKYYNIKTDM